MEYLKNIICAYDKIKLLIQIKKYNQKLQDKLKLYISLKSNKIVMKQSVI